LYATSANQIVQAYNINECSDGGSGVGSPTCDVLRTHVLPTGTTAANLERVVVSVVNGSYEILSGVDLVAQYTVHDIAQGTLSLGVAVTYTHKYLFGDIIENNGVKLAEGGDFAGYLNDGDPATPMPKLKGNMYMTYHRNRHHAGMYLYYTDSYKDVRPSIPSLADIDHHVTLDLHYTLELKDSLSVTLSVTNLSDEEPPQTSTDINYDSLSHSPFGRMIKLGVVYRLDI
jgi:outer membrane receptor protein involved in Fe transport